MVFVGRHRHLCSMVLQSRRVCLTKSSSLSHKVVDFVNSFHIRGEMGEEDSKCEGMSIAEKIGLGSLENEAFARCGVNESQLGGMETEAAVFLSVEVIAKDRDAETVGVGTVYAQLVGAACVGGEGDEGEGVAMESRRTVGGKKLVVGDGLLAVQRVDNLTGAVHGVGAKCEGNGALRRDGRRQGRTEQGYIPFIYSARVELLL